MLKTVNDHYQIKETKLPKRGLNSNTRVGIDTHPKSLTSKPAVLF